ncbi:MAG: serine/threonine protein kinase [Gammaproteobacteria bacterium]|nr:MAG: serine/threonine protein kinase [Gammaproteobacteria bacterium]TND03264.1 MAG: serine/threonine protein kinase [Gammaproteobacteria bacterium]
MHMDMPTAETRGGTSSTISRTARLLCGLALAAVVLCAYQWLELVAIKSGGTAPLCNVSETVNCAAVWNSPVSVAVHHITGIPIAGWGLTWGVVVLALAALMLMQSTPTAPAGIPIRALQLTIGVALAVCLLLLAYSIAIAVFCPTCLAFYLLVGVMTYMITRIPAGNNANWLKAAGLSAAVLIPVLAVVFAISLYSTRDSFAESTPSPQGTTSSSENPLARFLSSQPKDLQQYLSNVLAEYRHTKPGNGGVDATRVTWGDKNAPVHLVEWVEIRCSHCRDLHKNLDQLRELAPPDAWNIETRFFPLDSECNSSVQRSPGNGVSCLAAKLLICLAGDQKEDAVRAALFQNQSQLTTASIWELAGTNGIKREKLQPCIDAPATAKTLRQDIDLALQYKIEGTPLVVINGRKTVALPHMIFALIISQGRADDPGFDVLPPPEVAGNTDNQAL